MACTLCTHFVPRKEMPFLFVREALLGLFGSVATQTPVLLLFLFLIGNTIRVPEINRLQSWFEREPQPSRHEVTLRYREHVR